MSLNGRLTALEALLPPPPDPPLTRSERDIWIAGVLRPLAPEYQAAAETAMQATPDGTNRARLMLAAVHNLPDGPRREYAERVLAELRALREAGLRT